MLTKLQRSPVCTLIPPFCSCCVEIHLRRHQIFQTSTYFHESAVDEDSAGNGAIHFDNEAQNHRVARCSVLAVEGLHAEGVAGLVVDHDVMDAQPLVVEAAKASPGLCVVRIAPEIALIEIGRVLQICCLAGIAEGLLSGGAGNELKQACVVLLGYGRDQCTKKNGNAQQLPAPKIVGVCRHAVEPFLLEPKLHR